jgi:hypothetical protein
MNKREIARSVKKLITEVQLYNDKCPPHTEEDTWSGEVYNTLCSIPSPPKATGRVVKWKVSKLKK